MGNKAKKNDPRLRMYYRSQTAHCDCCDILFFRTLLIGFTILTTIAGAAIVGLSLVMIGAGQEAEELPDDHALSLTRITFAMISIGAIIIVMSIMGCLATVFESTWFTVAYVMTLVLCMAGQLSCGILTIFYRNEIRDWAINEMDCEKCYETYHKIMQHPTILAILMLATLGVQFAIIGTACKASHMRSEAKHALLLSEFIPSREICKQEAHKHYSVVAKRPFKKEAINNNNIEGYDEVDPSKRGPGYDLRPKALTFQPSPAVTEDGQTPAAQRVVVEGYVQVHE